MSADLEKAAAHLGAARDAYEAKDFALCRTEVLKAQAIDPDHRDVHRWLARLDYRAREWSSVREHTSAYLRSQPDDREMAQLGARACHNLRLWSEAAAAWRHVTRLRPDWPEGWYQLGRTLAKSGDAYEARRSGKRLRELGKRVSMAFLSAARVFLELDDLPAAADAYAALEKEQRGALDQELHNHESRGHLRGSAAVVAALRTFTDSEELRQKASQLTDNLIRLAISAERAGKLNDALQEYSAAALVSPTDTLAVRSASRVLQKLHEAAEQYVERREPAPAIHAYQEILRAVPANLRAATQLAKLRVQTQDWQKAAAAWLHVLELAPDNCQNRILYARSLERSGQLQAASAIWKQISEGDVGNQEATTALEKMPARMIKAGRAAFLERRYRDAWEMFSNVPTESPEREEAKRRLAQLGRLMRKDMRGAYKESRYLHVVENGAIALALLPDDRDLARLVAKAAMRVENFYAASTAWKHVLELGSEEFALGTETDMQNWLEYARCCIEIAAFEEGQAAIAAMLQRDPENARARVLELDLRERKLAQTEAQSFGEA